MAKRESGLSPLQIAHGLVMVVLTTRDKECATLVRPYVQALVPAVDMQTRLTLRRQMVTSLSKGAEAPYVALNDTPHYARALMAPLARLAALGSDDRVTVSWLNGLLGETPEDMRGKLADFEYDGLPLHPRFQEVIKGAGLEELTKEQTYHYLITGSDGQPPQIVRGTWSPVMFRKLVCYIQAVLREVAFSHTLTPTEIARLLKMFYSFKPMRSESNSLPGINLVEVSLEQNRMLYTLLEQRRILLDPRFQRKGLRELMIRLVAEQMTHDFQEGAMVVNR